MAFFLRSAMLLIGPLIYNMVIVFFFGFRRHDGGDTTDERSRYRDKKGRAEDLEEDLPA